MFDPLIKMLLVKLDALVDAYLERQQFINLIALPGTLLFLFLFWAFSGAGIATLLVGLLLVAVEVALAGGLYLLNEKYRDQIRESNDVADAIDAYLSGADVFGEWNQFLQTPLADPELESVRRHCAMLSQQYPPANQGEHCGPEGLPVLESMSAELRVGIATKFYRELSIWRAARQMAKEGGFEQPQTGGVRHMPSLTPTSFMDDSTQERVEKEATKEARRAVREARKEAKRAAKAARKANRKAAAAELKRLKKGGGIEDYDLPDDQVYDDQGFVVQSSGPATPMVPHIPREAPMQPAPGPLQPPAAPMQPPPAPMQPPPAPMQPPPAPMQSPAAPMQAPAAPIQPPAAPMQPPAPAPVAHQPAVQSPVMPPAHRMAPPPPPPRKRHKGGLSEAGAIQQVMRSGYTAHHYDQAQQTLARRLGRDPQPAEVVRALIDNNWGKGPKKKKRRKSRKAKVRAATVRVTRSVSSLGAPNFDSPSPHEHRGRRRRRGRGALRFMTVLALVASSPFVAWRLKRPETRPLIVTGQVHHQVLDKAPDFQHRIRTPFEELFGNRPINLVDGRRIYVSAADYKLCWPESWEQIYEKDYSIVIDAEVEPLLFGGFGVARITSAERVDGPLATAH